MASELPAGFATFLFTDIEGSTQLWERYPEAMKAALARHDQILRQVIQKHGGIVFKTMGDAFLVVFSLQQAALLATVEAQQNLQQEDWGEACIKVRMALHCGEAETRDNDYFGPPLNRTARLLSAGHGGQVLISAAMQAALSQLPEGVSLRDMGERRLKDLLRPEHIYQIVIAGLPADFAPIKTLDPLRTNLPEQVTSFIGREHEISEVRRLLRQNRLVTLTGVGGTGKTRLALQVASTMLDDFPDGVWFVELASITDPELVPQTIATTLQLHEQAGHSASQVINDFLETRQSLLLLDNCEHLIQPCAQWSAQLLQHCAGLKILATTREPLGVAGEFIWSVPSFSCPANTDSLTPEVVAQFDAVKLFVIRAQAAQANFALTPENATAVAQICSRLDGIPLAIELAAARVRSMNVEQIASRLDSRFRLLTGGSRSALPRQQTLGALVDWSYNLLAANEQLLFLRLSIFTGPFTLEAAEQVCQGDGIEEWEVLDLLQKLIDKSLAQAEERYTQTYYRLLETIRQYGREKLLATDAAESLANQHAQYFLQSAVQNEENLRGPGQVAAIRRMNILRDNFRAALKWVIESGQTETALQLARHLGWYWFANSDHNEGRQWLIQAAALPDSGQYACIKSDLLTHLAHHTWLQLGSSHALSIAEEAISLAKSCATPWYRARVLMILSLIQIFEGKQDVARVQLEESLVIFQETGDSWNLAQTILCQATNENEHAVTNADHETALNLYREAYELFHKIGDYFFQSVCLRSIYEELIILGQTEKAISAIRQGLVLSYELGSKSEISGNLFGMVLPAIQKGENIRAVQLGYAARNLQETIGMWKKESETWFQGLISPCQAALPPEEFLSAIEQGRTLPLEQVIRLALSDTA